MDLYSLGIQYYLENDPIQAKYFQDRMGFLLTNKDILMKLKKQQEKEEKEKNTKDEEKEWSILDLLDLLVDVSDNPLE